MKIIEVILKNLNIIIDMKQYIILMFISVNAYAFSWKFNLLKKPVVIPPQQNVWTWTMTASKAVIGGSSFYSIYVRKLDGTILSSHTCPGTWSIGATGIQTPVGGTCPYYMDGTVGTVGGCYSSGTVVQTTCTHD